MPNKGHFGLKSLVSRHIEENLNNTMSLGDPFSERTIAFIRLFRIQGLNFKTIRISSISCGSGCHKISSFTWEHRGDSLFSIAAFVCIDKFI